MALLLTTTSVSFYLNKNIFDKLEDMREIINIQLGQCGNNIGYHFLQTIAQEHSITAQGIYTAKHDQYRQRLDVFFNEQTDGSFNFRSILVDTEPGTIDNLRAEKFARLYNCDNFNVGVGSAGNNWAQGYYGKGAQLIEYIMDSIRNQADNCDSLEGFQIIQGTGGGTGSGLGSLLIKRLRDQYSHIIQTFTVLPNSTTSSNVLQAYNSVLSFPNLIDHAQMCHMLCNQAIQGLCQKKKKIASPTIKDLNQLVSTVMSGVSSGFRFPGQMNTSLRKLAVNLIPFPRLHFFSSSISPYLSNKSDKTRNFSVKQTILELFDYQNNLTGVKSYQGRYLTASVVLKGKVSAYEAETQISNVKNKNSSYFVEWIPDNISSSYCNVPFQGHEVSGVLVSNHLAIKNVYKQLSQQFVALFRRKAYVHWYTSIGMDEMQFTQYQSCLNDLISECDWDSCGCDGCDSEQNGQNEVE